VKYPILVGFNFDKNFLIYSYALEEAYAVMMMQKDDQGHEKSIAFLS